MTSYKSAVVRLVSVLLTAGCLLSVNVFAEPTGTTNEFDELPMDMNNPGSIVDRLEEDAEPKDYLFQIPGASGVLNPWYDMKAGLDEKYGLRFGISYTSYYQKAIDSFGFRSRSLSDVEFSSRTRLASERAHSRKAGSFNNVSAWTGTLERSRRVQAVTRSGVSNIGSNGWGVSRHSQV